MPKNTKRKTTSTRPLIIGITAAALALLTSVASFNQLRGETVIEVIDGDTYRIANKQVVRLYSIDAPDLELCMGRDAKAKLSSLILGKRVTLQNIRSGGFNRVMGFSYVDGKSVETEMMKSGYSVLTRGTKELPELLEASTYARQKKLGVYSEACYQLEPENPKCNIKGNIGETKRDRYYFTPSCPNYTQTVVWTSFGDKWFCSEKEAENAGFVRGTKCK